MHLPVCMFSDQMELFSAMKMKLYYLQEYRWNWRALGLAKYTHEEKYLIFSVMYKEHGAQKPHSY